ncbi:MAG: hypothetical protein VX641_04225, partial [Planctomycetota bacterium]|nr:hypothetical protein [Planctomycetota bacterium]
MSRVRLATTFGLLLLTIGVLWPLVSAVLLVSSPPLDPVPDPPGSAVILRTLLWSILVPVVALVPGLLAGHLLGLALARPAGQWVVSTLTLAPLCIPGYAVFWCGWQALGPGSALGAWAITHDAVTTLKQGVLLLALVSWCWPLIAWPVALAGRTPGGCTCSLAALDGAGPGRRLGLWVRSRVVACVLGMMLAGFLVASATVSFDLAQISTVGFELRALDAQGVLPGQLIRYSWPSFLVAVVCTLMILIAFARGTDRWQDALSHRLVRSRLARPSKWVRPILFALSLGSLLPVLLAIGRIGELDVGIFWSLYGPAVLRTIWGAILDGTICAFIAVLLHIQFTQGSDRIRLLALVMAGGWLLVGRLPAATLAAIVTGTLNTPTLGPLLYDSSIALLIAEVANLAGFACLIALLVSAGESRAARSMRSLDPPRLRAIRPGLNSTAVLAFVVTAVLSLGELILATRLGLPGRERIATGLLNAMHYQRPDTVMIGLLVLVFGGGLTALLAGRVISRKLL